MSNTPPKQPGYHPQGGFPYVIAIDGKNFPLLPMEGGFTTSLSEPQIKFLNQVRNIQSEIGRSRFRLVYTPADGLRLGTRFSWYLDDSEAFEIMAKVATESSASAYEVHDSPGEPCITTRDGRSKSPHSITYDPGHLRPRRRLTLRWPVLSLEAAIPLSEAVAANTQEAWDLYGLASGPRS